MTKKFVSFAASAALLSLAPLASLALSLSITNPASAMGEGKTVTKETQAREGLNYTLSAVRASETAVLVHMEIPNSGKLANLKQVHMVIGTGNGSPEVYAPLQTTTSKDGTLIVSFQVSPTLSDKCSIELITSKFVPEGFEFYAIEIKGYITKPAPTPAPADEVVKAHKPVDRSVGNPTDKPATVDVN